MKIQPTSSNWTLVLFCYACLCVFSPNADGKSNNSAAKTTIDKSIVVMPTTATATTTTTQNQLRVKGKTFMIDPGHGGHDLGAKCGKASEKDVVLAVAFKVKAALERGGARVVMTRNADYFVPLLDRVAMNNRVNPYAYVSIHCNDTNGAKSAHGIEVYYLTPQSLTLAMTINGSLVNGLRATDRGVRQRQLCVVHNTRSPSILAEIGFLSNDTERAKLCSSGYQTEVAIAIAGGLTNYSRSAKASLRLAGR